MLDICLDRASEPYIQHAGAGHVAPSAVLLSMLGARGSIHKPILTGHGGTGRCS